jgi:hypothetical protein
MIQPAAIIWNLSDGEFDLVHHSQVAWRLFSDSLHPNLHKKDEENLTNC